MSSFEDNPADSRISSDAPAKEFAPVLTGGAPSPPARDASVPEDLRISWSWQHFIIFIVFSIGSLFIVQLIFITYLESVRGLTSKEVERLFTTKAQFPVAVQVAWCALILLFLYVTLSVLKDAPFWSTIGWRRLPADKTRLRNRAWPYFFAGSGLSLLVAVASIGVHPKENTPIEKLLKDPHGTLLLMAMAVLVAPLVEETLFRGYLYPFFARKMGVPVGIILTGVLFGLMHGSQLGWSWGIVALLILVGVVFTYARARTGTVFASYLLHLGYNSLLAVFAALATHGFRQVPPAH
jgi:membrane protease YdiL (CAAX protease family)